MLLGGTITYRSEADGPVQRLTAAQLLADLPPVAASLHVRTWASDSSASLEPETVLRMLVDARSTDCDGFVVVQGTDTIEEDSYLADLVWDDPRPLVFTGAMRPPAAVSADGPANVWSALQVASSGLFAEAGVLVVMNDQVHAARFVRKTHATATNSLTSPAAGPVGLVVEGVVHRIAELRPQRSHVPLRSLTHVVPVVAPALGEGPGVLDVIGPLLDGLVVMGMGGGHVPPAMVEDLQALAVRVPVVLSCRAYGMSLTRTYRSPGSEGDLLGRGLLPAGVLSAWQSRLLLLVGLACDYGRDELAAAFADAGVP